MRELTQILTLILMLATLAKADTIVLLLDPTPTANNPPSLRWSQYSELASKTYAALHVGDSLAVFTASEGNHGPHLSTVRTDDQNPERLLRHLFEQKMTNHAGGRQNFTSGFAAVEAYMDHRGERSVLVLLVNKANESEVKLIWETADRLRQQSRPFIVIAPQKIDPLLAAAGANDLLAAFDIYGYADPARWNLYPSSSPVLPQNVLPVQPGGGPNMLPPTPAPAPLLVPGNTQPPPLDELLPFLSDSDKKPEPLDPFPIAPKDNGEGEVPFNRDDSLFDPLHPEPAPVQPQPTDPKLRDVKGVVPLPLPLDPIMPQTPPERDDEEPVKPLLPYQPPPEAQNRPDEPTTNRSWPWGSIAIGLVILVGVGIYLAVRNQLKDFESGAETDIGEKLERALRVYDGNIYHSLGEMSSLSPVFIGSDPSNTICLPLPVEAKHLRAFVVKGGIWVKNLSNRSILINDTELAPGKQVQIFLPTRIQLCEGINIRFELTPLEEQPELPPHLEPTGVL